MIEILSSPAKKDPNLSSKDSKPFYFCTGRCSLACNLIQHWYSIKPYENGNSIFIIKANTLGETIWTKNYGGTLAYNLYESNDSLILLASADYSPFYPITTVLKLNSQGDFHCNLLPHTANSQTINSITNSPYQLKKTCDTVIQEPSNITYDTNAYLAYIDYCKYTNVNEINSSKEFTVYPNPATDVIFISTPTWFEDKNLELNIYDSFGQLVFKINPSIPIKIPVSFLPNGFYEVLLFSNNENFFSSKFVKMFNP